MTDTAGHAMKKFTPIALPLAYRRSSLAKALRLKINVFATLLAQLAPQRYLAVRDGSLADIYMELIEVVSARFPVWEPDYFFDEFDDEEEAMGYAEQMGIPVESVGLDEDDDRTYENSMTLSLLSYLMIEPAHRLSVEQVRTGRSWIEVKALEPWFNAHLEEKWIAPPRGRAWAGRWQNLPLLVQYIEHNTGYQWLDLSSLDLDEGGNPPWSMADIEFLTRDWAATKPVWTALTRFIAWLDQAPETRLPRLLRALTGDEAARNQLSEPKKPGRTLVEIFNAEEKRNHARTR